MKIECEIWGFRAYMKIIARHADGYLINGRSVYSTITSSPQFLQVILKGLLSPVSGIML